MIRPGVIGLICLLWGAAVMVCGQPAQITGRITSRTDAGPLTGAHVMLQNTSRLTTSDFDGNYRLVSIAPGEYRIMVSYVGYSTSMRDVTLKANDHIALDFELDQIPFIMDEAVITGNKVMAPKSSSPLTLSVVTREVIEQSGETNVLPVLSSRIPGVFVTERGITGFGVGEGSAGKITVRGIGGSPNTQVLVMIDGHPQFAGIFGHPLSDAYVAAGIEKVEVVRGPVSLLYGTNAMAGAINIITRQQDKDGVLVSARAQFGSFNTQKYTASLGYKKNKFHILGSFNHDQTDGHRDNSDFDITDGYLKAGYELSSHFRILVNASLASYHTTDPGPVYTTDTTYQNGGHWGDFLRGEGSVALENKYRRSEGAFRFYYNGGEHTIYDGFHSTDHLTGITLYQGLKLWPDNLITVGIDYQRYGGFAENTIPVPPITFTDTAIFEIAGYLLLQNTISEKLSATAGLRLEDHELFGTEWIPQIGINWYPSQATVVKATISKGFRSPTIQELFLFTPANPQLEPERMWNFETGVTQYFFKEHLSIELNGFLARGSNLIQMTGVYPDVKNKNSGKFTHYGVEFQGRMMLTDHLHLMGSYSWLHTDKARIAAPAHQLFLEGSYQWKKLLIILEMNYIHDLVTRTDPEVVYQRYALCNARLSYQVASFVSAWVAGQNLLNQSYQINDGYPMPGINAMGGIDIRFETKKE